MWFFLSGYIDKWYVPLVYILAPSKNKKMYEQAFKALLNSTPELKPKHIITDFELAAIVAAKDVFENVHVHGCMFHFCQSIWRHIQHIGLQQRYASDADFALNIRQIMALAFIPSHDVRDTFDQLCETEFWNGNENNEDFDKIQDLLNYFEMTYIGINTRTQSKRRKCLFEPDLWSSYESTITGENKLLP